MNYILKALFDYELELDRKNIPDIEIYKTPEKAKAESIIEKG